MPPEKSMVKVIRNMNTRWPLSAGRDRTKPAVMVTSMFTVVPTTTTKIVLRYEDQSSPMEKMCR